MKIISWNLKNLGLTKLSGRFTPAFAQAGMGNDVLDYIVKVVMGDPAVWSGVITPTPPDVFVALEVVSGEADPGSPATGGAPLTLARLANAMNTAATALGAAGVSYQAVNPLVVGRRETIGIIYNDQSLTYQQSGILRNDTAGTPFDLRAPFWAQFTTTPPGTTVNVVGIHAPRPGGPDRYEQPIQYANALTDSARISAQNVGAADACFVAGDFNCGPGDTYGDPPVAFQLPNYTSALPPGTWSTLRRRLQRTSPRPTNYLANAYDNVLYVFGAGVPASPTEDVPDLIYNARNVNAQLAPMYPDRLVLVFNNYTAVSDHLPVILEY